MLIQSYLGLQNRNTESYLDTLYPDYMQGWSH